MLGGLRHSLALQWRIRGREIAFFGGAAFLVFGTDHLIIRKSIRTLHSIGIIHNGPKLTKFAD